MRKFYRQQVLSSPYAICMTICDRLLLCGSRLCTSSNNATRLVYLVRLHTISTTFVTKVMGSTGDVESGLRAALASAPLTDAALGDVITNVLSIINDAIEPGGLMGMTISSSHTSLQATPHRWNRVCGGEPRNYHSSIVVLFTRARCIHRRLLAFWVQGPIECGGVSP